MTTMISRSSTALLINETYSDNVLQWLQECVLVAEGVFHNNDDDDTTDFQDRPFPPRAKTYCVQALQLAATVRCFQNFGLESCSQQEN